MRRLITSMVLLLTVYAAAQQANTASTPTLSPKAIEAYGIKAEQKVREFYDYLQILSDPSINTDMKDHTMREALKLYRSEHVDIQHIFNIRGGEITIYKLLKDIRSFNARQTFDIRNFESEKIDSTPSLQVWELSYDLISNNTSLHKIKQQFYIVLEDKKFGNATKKVWNNYLGELRYTLWQARKDD